MKTLDKFIRRYTSLSSAINYLKCRELVLLGPQSWDDRNDRYFMSLYREKLALGGIYGICAARCTETYHHWRVFTSAADGVCIEIKREPLEAELAQIDDVRFGEVEYLNLEEVEGLTSSEVNRLPFVKRSAFEPEQEYRIIAEDADPQQPALVIDLPLAWINRIYLNPWMPASVAESVTAALKKLCGRTPVDITRSHLIDSARWKKAGDSVIGRKPLRKRLKLKP